MALHNEIGQRGEEIARHYLLQEGHRILEINWRFSRAEIDIISLHNSILIFTEVKTRSSDLFGLPEEAIDHHKESLMSDAAAVYMEQIGYEAEIRFDIISIVLKDTYAYHLEHFEDAFFPSF